MTTLNYKMTTRSPLGHSVLVKYKDFRINEWYPYNKENEYEDIINDTKAYLASFSKCITGSRLST